MQVHSSIKHVLISCKNEVDPIKNDVASLRVTITFLPLCPDAQGQVYPQSMIGSCRISKSSVRITSKNEEDPIKYEGTRMATRLNAYFSDTHGQTIP